MFSNNPLFISVSKCYVCYLYQISLNNSSTLNTAPDPEAFTRIPWAAVSPKTLLKRKKRPPWRDHFPRTRGIPEKDPSREVDLVDLLLIC